MSDRLSKLIKRFAIYMSVPWRAVLSAEERAVFVVYHKEDELKLRARVQEFQLVVEQNGHRWQLLDITDGFAKWMGSTTMQKPTSMSLSCWWAVMNFLPKS